MTALDPLFTGRDSAIAKDLKLNLQRLLGEDSTLAGPEGPLALLALGTALASESLAGAARELAAPHSLPPEALQEAAESAALMGMLNVYYRFKHFLTEGQGESHVQEHYRAAGLRMQGMAKPVLGKTRFEMLAFTVSVLNGCEACVNAHEQELVKHGVSRELIHDLARLAAVAKAVATLSYTPSS